MPSVSTRSPAWKHQSELALVRDWFYPRRVALDIYAPSATHGDDNRIRAVERVKVWTLKTLVPHSVTVTAELTTAQLTYEQASLVGCASLTGKVSTFIHDYGIRATYIMAFTRFVNGFVDKDVAGGAGESSMFANAAKIGMPRSFVDLRHRATHGKEMIGLAELKKATGEALDWIWEYWWKVNATGDPGRAVWEVQEWERDMDEANRTWRMQQSVDQGTMGNSADMAINNKRKRQRSVLEEAEELA